ncbi:MAG: protein kinase [Verrucomicrobia bacterium]|nr:protein kinase [Verrucomicrobiota bacterium]
MPAPVPPPTCPSCGASLPGGSLVGICAACAWKEIGIEEPAARSPEVLFTVPDHEVLAEIARGGGGIVYRARQLQPRRDVALKMLPPVLLPSRELQHRFRLEAETIASLHHPGILPVHTVGEKDGLPYFTMKLAAGGTLTARREQYRGRWRDIATLIAGLAEAVQHAHSRGVVHRDLKPGNVLFDDEGRAYVSDFGLAKFTTAEPSTTRSQAVVGTPAYLAPEVLAEGAGAATTASDVYGLGAILYELLAGRPPFGGENVAELLRQVADELPRAPSGLVRGVPRDLEVIALRCLEKDPSKRLPSAAAVAEDLRSWLGHRPIQARPVGGGERLARWARRNPALAGLTAVLAIALLGGAVVLERSNRRLRGALSQTEAAERQAQENLHRALLDQARLLRTSGQRGQRHEALEVLGRAAAIRPSPEVRHEVAAALARTDLRFERPLRAYFASELATVEFAPDFQSYLSATGQPDFVRLDSRDGSIVRRYRPEGAGQPLAFTFSGDSRRFAVTFADRRIECWAVDGGKPLWVVPPRGQLSVAVALHPQEPACAWADEKGAVRVRDLIAGGERVLVPPGERVVRLRYSPDGRRLAVLRAREFVVVDAVSGDVRWNREGRPLAVDPAWSGDGRWLAVAEATRGEIEVLAGETGRVVRVLAGGGEPPQLLEFVPGRPRLASISRNSTLRLWEVLSGDLLFQTGMPPRTLAFSPDGRWMAGARRWLEIGVFVWAEEEVLREFRGEGLTRERGNELAVSPDGRWLATSDAREVRVWDAVRGEECARVAVTGANWTSVQFDPRGGRLLYSTMNRGVLARPLVEVAAAGGGTTLQLGAEVPLGPHRHGRLLGFGDNGDWYIEREAIERVVVWPQGDPTRERPLAESRRYDRPTISRDGQYVATMGYPEVKVRVTHLASGAPPVILPVRHHAGAAFAPDGRWLVTGTDTEFQTWTLPGLKAGPRWERPLDGSRWGTPVFSPDGRWLACDRPMGEVEVRDTRDWSEQVRLIPPVRVDINSVAWSREGDRLYVLGTGHRVFEWNLSAFRRELAARKLAW